MRVSRSTLDESKIRDQHNMINSVLQGALNYLENAKSRLALQAYNEIKLGLTGLLEENEKDSKEDLYIARQNRMMVI